MQSKTLKILSYGSMAVVIAMMMAATFVERLHDTDTALRVIYHNPVFFVLWAVAAVSGFALLLRQGGAKRPATLLLHVALLLILAGALITHLGGKSGSIHLREGVPSSALELDDGTSDVLPFSLELKEFRIEYDPGTENVSDYVSELVCEGEPVTISMNHILKHDGWRFYQADYDEDGAGSILAVSRDPWGVGVTYAGYLLLLVAMIGYFFQRDSTWRRARTALRGPEKVRRRRALPWVLAAAGAAMLAAWLISVFPKGPLMPVLRSPLLFIHMLPIIVSYALFGLTTLLGLVGLFVRENTSERLRNVSLRVLFPAVFLLTFGTFLGAVWANISWGSYWAWDPKETWALVTLLVYSFALHADTLPVLRKPRVFHLFCVLAFLAVLTTYFGVNLFLGGMHSYA